jgi:succinoglycan biosynthesis protein ExoM
MLNERRPNPSGTAIAVPLGIEAEEPRPISVCIGVCTAARPQLLKKCLASLAVQQLPADTACHLVVVDNNTEPSALSAVQAIASEYPFSIIYAHERRRGISFARNRVLEEALSIGADWIAFIDDDETAPPNWLLEMILASQGYEADVIQGPVKSFYPDPLPFWALPKSLDLCEGEKMKFAATSNVIFSSKLIRNDGMDLRFDEAMGISGGEDTDFFLRANDAGAKIIFSCKPVIYEEVFASRLSFKRQMQRAFRNGANDVYLKRKQYGSARIFLRRLPQIFLRIPRGILQLVTSPLFLTVSTCSFKKNALEGGRKTFKSLGVLGGLAGIRPKPYRKIDGY